MSLEIFENGLDGSIELDSETLSMSLYLGMPAFDELNDSIKYLLVEVETQSCAIYWYVVLLSILAKVG